MIGFPRLRATWCVLRGRHRSVPDSVTETPVGPMIVERCEGCGAYLFQVPVGDLTDSEIDEFVEWIERTVA